VQFLNELFPGEPETVDFTELGLGYSLLGFNPAHAGFLCFGSGGNGKSVLLESTSDLLGSYAGLLTPDVLISDLARSGTALLSEVVALRGCRLVTSTEPRKGALNGPRWKQWTGDSYITVDEYPDVVDAGHHIEVAAARYFLQGDPVARGRLQFAAEPLGDIPFEGRPDVVNACTYGSLRPRLAILDQDAPPHQGRQHLIQLLGVSTDAGELFARPRCRERRAQQLPCGSISKRTVEVRGRH
jgi:hypothetical protein